MSFLHENGIVHGNIRGVGHYRLLSHFYFNCRQSNVLITDAGHALLTDTGINATVVDTCDYIPLPENASWMAPELFIWDEDEKAEVERTNTRTSMSDVYSFGRTIEEVAIHPTFTTAHWF